MKTITEFKGKWMWVRKKPVSVKAIQLTEDAKIETLEGTMIGRKGDWIIQGVEGEIYPIKNRIFRKAYEWV